MFVPARPDRIELFGHARPDEVKLVGHEPPLNRVKLVGHARPDFVGRSLTCPEPTSPAPEFTPHWDTLIWWGDGFSTGC